MNAAFHPDAIRLDLLPLGTRARVATVDWAALDDGEPTRLRHFGFDEAVTRDVLLGRQKGERQPDALVIVVDASNLDNHLRFTLQLLELGLPTIIALNMVDLAGRDGLELDSKVLENELGVPVIETVAVRRRG